MQLASRAYLEASNAAFYLGNLQKAVDYGKKAFELASEIDDRVLKLTALSSLHRAYRDLKNFSRARELIELGLEHARDFAPGSMHQSWWKAVFYAHRSWNFAVRRQYPKAIHAERAICLYDDFLSRLPESGRRSEARKETAITNMVGIYARLGRIYLAMNKTDDALKHYRLGLDLARSGNLEFSQPSLFQGIGDVYVRLGEYTNALKHFQRALDLARRQQRVDRISAMASRIGDILRKTGKLTEAVTFYREAIEQTESVRSLLRSRFDRRSYFGGGLGTYADLIAVLLEIGVHDQAFHYSERVRARTFLDMLGTKVQLSRANSPLAEEERALVELDENDNGEDAYREFLRKVSKVNPEQASLMSVQPFTLKDVRRLLRPGQVLLEYLVTSEKTYLWAVEQSGLRAYILPVGRKDLVVKIGALRGAISNLSSLDDYHRIAQDLYNQLLSPVASALRGKDLILVPHDVLHYLPFHALYSPTGKYLVEDHTISYLPSASLLQFVSDKRRQGSNQILSIGNPRANGHGGDLPLAELEATEIKNHFPGATVLVKENAGEAKVKSLSPHYDVLHFAAHAELYEKDPLASSVLLAEGEGEDGRLEVREIFEMNLNANLVVLSGCETGLGELYSGDELIGLTRAFIYAGTPSVVASLWKVDDASTAHLMSGFYKNLKTMTKVTALRHAQLAMIRGGGQSDLLARRGVGGIGKLGETPSAMPSAPSAASVSTSHPYFWAPFILVGDGK